MAEKIWRGGMGLRPAPGPRRYWRPSGRVTTGTSGSTLAQNASETIQHLICGILELIFARFAPLYALFFAIENQVQHYLRISSKYPPTAMRRYLYEIHTCLCRLRSALTLYLRKPD